MAVSDGPREADFERARSNLRQGLRACRAVVRGYRALIADESGGAGHPPPDNDRRRFCANDPD